MARQTGAILENKFIKGLITENTALSFPTDACTETWNCVFDETGEVTRRRGIDLETNNIVRSISYASGDAVSEYLWNNVGYSSDTSLSVQQIGSVIHFFDVSSTTTVSSDKKSFTIDLATYTENGSATTVRAERCSFTQGRGTLFIANRYFKPLAVTYDEVEDAIEIQVIEVQRRDTDGIDTGLDIDERPEATIRSLDGDHIYNLLNQGWYVGTGNKNVLVQWEADAAHTHLPSNADQVGFYRDTPTDPYDPDRVSSFDPGNSPAPRGHFILSVGYDDRYLNLFPRLSNIFATDSSVEVALMSYSDLYTEITDERDSIIGDFTSTANIFDEDTSTEGVKSTTAPRAYIGIDLGVGNERNIGGIDIVAGPDGNSPADGQDSTVYLYASNSAPATATNGTILGQKNLAKSAGVVFEGTGVSIISNDIASTYRYVWCTIVSDDATTTYAVSIFRVYEANADSRYPGEVIFFNGRLFYGGYSLPQLANKVFFTQVLEREEQYGYCYTTNDPSSELIKDAIASDGGSIEFSNMGSMTRMIEYQGQLLILARNGVWTLSGTNGPFSALGYQARRISDISCFSPESVVLADGIPIWWAEDGIYTVQYDANYDSSTVRALTDQTIKSFYQEIPVETIQYVKGCYDKVDDVVYWLYHSNSASAAWNYNRALCLNMLTGAFYPWSIATSGTNAQRLVGIIFVETGDRTAISKVKMPVIFNSNASLSYAQEFQTTYTDWENYAIRTVDTDDENDYESYFISGYRLEGEGMRNFQGNYIHMFMKKETDASAFVQGIYEFTSSGNSGNWSTPQQAYNSATSKGQDLRDIKRRRLKIRGHGTSLQIKVTSETAKPFTIIGWGIYATANQSV